MKGMCQLMILMKGPAAGLRVSEQEEAAFLSGFSLTWVRPVQRVGAESQTQRSFVEDGKTQNKNICFMHNKRVAYI